MLRIPSFVLLSAALFGALFAAPALALTVDLAVDASTPAPNDLIRATVAADVTGASPADLAQKANSAIAEGLRVTKAYPAVKVRTGGAHSYPMYAQNGKIERWRMRSEILLESRDPGALGELLGKLQTQLLVANVTASPSPETRAKAEERAVLDAISAFHARAKLVAGAFGKPYKIKTLNVGTQSGPVMPLMMKRGMAMAAEAMPMPVEAGESQVAVTVTGQVEIPD